MADNEMVLAAGADRAEPEDDGAEDDAEGSDEDGADDGMNGSEEDGEAEDREAKDGVEEELELPKSIGVDALFSLLC